MPQETDLKIFVILIPKEGLTGGARQYFFWYDTDLDFISAAFTDYIL